MQLTYRYRIKDKNEARLKAEARAASTAWKLGNGTQQRVVRFGLRWPSGPDRGKPAAGATKKGLDLHSHWMRVCQDYAKARRQYKKRWLRWRGGRSLGWVPFNTGHAAGRDVNAAHILPVGLHTLVEGASS